MTPLSGGFDPAKRVENAGSVRLTQSGLTFLQANLGTLAGTLLGKGTGMGGVINFAVPESKVPFALLGITIATLDICGGGAMTPQCNAEIDLSNAKLNIATEGPNNVHVTGTLPLRIQDLVITGLGTIDVSLTGDGSCVGTAQSAYAEVPIDVMVSVAVDQNPMQSMAGYTAITVTSIASDSGALTTDLSFCGGITGDIVGFLKGIIVPNLLYPQLIKTLQTTIDKQLCEKANPMVTPACPTGTTDVSGICRYGTTDTDPCASTLLGLNGHMNLGTLLQKISPGTTGGLDILFAAGGKDPRPDNSGAYGDLDPVANGATLGMYGGAQPQPIAGCVKLSDLTLPTGIPIPDELFGNTVPNWPANLSGPDVGIAVSERFANYALSGIYNSGLLCIGVTTETVALLNSGTFGLLANSLKDLGIQQEAQQLAIVVRPSAPPQVTFGGGTNGKTDPLIRVKMSQASFDFYVFSLDRFIRFMTATFDLDVPVNLIVTPAGLQPAIDSLGVNNGKVTNSQLLKEDPATLASALSGLIGSQVGQALGGALKPIAISSLLKSTGLSLTIPPTVTGKGSPGLTKLSKGSDNFLGIFATLGLAKSKPVHRAGATSAAIISKRVDPAGLRLVTVTPENAPAVRMHLTSEIDDGSQAVEYQYRVDQGFWRSFSEEKIVDVQDDWLRLQGRHTIFVRSRVVGDTDTLDEEPFALEVLVDTEAPAIAIAEVEGTSVALRVRDNVSTAAQTQVRTRLDGGAWSAWQPATDHLTVEVGTSATLSVEAKDEEGNTGTAQEALIRGKLPENAMAAAGCGCTAAGTSGATPRGAWLLGVAIFAGLFSRGRERGLRGARRTGAAADAPRGGRTARRFAHGLGALAVVGVAGSWMGCSCGNAQQDAASTGGPVTCATCITLKPGLIGAYTSVAASGSTVWVAGYSEADYANSMPYGDLVVGKLDGAKVKWEQVDGVPGTTVDATQYNVNGFRGGQTAPGDDVGIWTSTALDASGNPIVSYYDRTNQRLKVAQYDGKGWTVAVVDSKPSSDVGRYSKILALSGGGFAIAYLSIEPGGTNGMLISRVRVATTSAPKPAATDWTIEDAMVTPTTPCRAAFCTSSEVCLSTTHACVTPAAASACNPACASGSSCVGPAGKAACVVTWGTDKIDSYPDATGDYISIAADPLHGGIGIAFYDRIDGNLLIASKAGGQWTHQIVDGQTAAGADTGDEGIGASLVIDASGDWHLSYVDGYAEAVRYLKVSKGTTPGMPELVDTGLLLAGTAFSDGQHVVGDDSHLEVTPAGEIHITYQDSTAGTLRYAVGTPTGTAHTWTVSAVQQNGFAGAFSNIVTVNGQAQLMNWWRVGGANEGGDVAFVALP